MLFNYPLLYLGGGLDLAFGTAFLDTAKFLYDKAVAANDRGMIGDGDES